MKNEAFLMDYDAASFHRCAALLVNDCSFHMISSTNAMPAGVRSQPLYLLRHTGQCRSLRST